MPRGPQPEPIQITPNLTELLESIVRRQTASQSLVRRATIILNLSQAKNNQQVATRLNLPRETIRTWRQRWLNAFPTL